MAKFLKGNQVNSELENIIDTAKEILVIISPYIKLHNRFKDSLKQKLDNPRFEITIVFGKNDDNIGKSINKEDIEFFQQFSNIEIRYESRLHAKYYSNESSAILSSMNLYDYSSDHNIEFGILTKNGKLLSDKLDADAFNYFQNVIDKHL